MTDDEKDLLLVVNLKECLRSIKKDTKDIKRKYKGKKIPHHELENWSDNRTMIYSLKNVINYFSPPGEHGPN